MALRKTLISKNGIETNYHKITLQDSYVKIEDEKEIFNFRATVHSYVSEDIRRQSQGYSANSKHFEFSAEASELAENGVYATAYNRLKATEEFADAEDC